MRNKAIALLTIVYLSVPALFSQSLMGPDAEVQELEHDTQQGTYNSLVQVDSDTYLLAYQGLDGDGFIKTFTISADGATVTQVQSLGHDNVNGSITRLFKSIRIPIYWHIQAKITMVTSKPLQWPQTGPASPRCKY